LGFFRASYTKPGPGVPKDEPRKKGVARFFEVLGRDFGDLLKLNLLFCICVLPSIAAFIAGLFGYYFGIMLIVSLLAAFPVGGAVTAYMFYITKMLRDDPSFVWFDFKRKFLENYRQAAPVGMICMAFVYAQIWLWGSFMLGDPGIDVILPFVAFLSIIVFLMITPYFFLHFAYIDLNTIQTVKNSVLMSLAYIPRSFMGALLGGLMWIAFALFFPVSLLFVPIVILIGISISILLNLMWIWPPFDSHFKIEETLIKRLEEEESGEA